MSSSSELKLGEPALSAFWGRIDSCARGIDSYDNKEEKVGHNITIANLPRTL